MKVTKVLADNRKRVFAVHCGKRGGKRVLEFPFSKLRLCPSHNNSVSRAWPDPDVSNQGFSYELVSGHSDTVPLDAVLEYHRDPNYLREIILYKLTLAAQEIIKSKGIRKRELVRRLGTSPSQLYRLLDQTFYGKTIDQMHKLLHILGCALEVTIKEAA
jgi:hypothetical protein